MLKCYGKALANVRLMNFIKLYFIYHISLHTTVETHYKGIYLNITYTETEFLIKGKMLKPFSIQTNTRYLANMII